MRTNWRTAVLPLAVLAAVSGCAVQPAQRPADLAAAVITANLATLRQSWQLINAENTIARQCMRKIGFDYLISEEPRPSVNTGTEDQIGTGRPVTYGVQPPKAGPPAEDQYVNGLAEPLRSRYLTALDGPAGPLGTIRMPSGTVADFITGGRTADAQRRDHDVRPVPLHRPRLPVRADVVAAVHGGGRLAGADADRGDPEPAEADQRP